MSLGSLPDLSDAHHLADDVIDRFRANYIFRARTGIRFVVLHAKYVTST